MSALTSGSDTGDGPLYVPLVGTVEAPPSTSQCSGQFLFRSTPYTVTFALAVALNHVIGVLFLRQNLFVVQVYTYPSGFTTGTTTNLTLSMSAVMRASLP